MDTKFTVWADETEALVWLKVEAQDSPGHTFAAARISLSPEEARFLAQTLTEDAAVAEYKPK